MESTDHTEGRQHLAAGPPARAGAGRVAGVVLAAGAGTRMGIPKALVGDARGPWLPRAVALLSGAGCDPVLAVLGARADDAARLLADDPRVMPVVAAGWAGGLGASLRAGLDAASGLGGRGEGPTAVLVTLVDLPHVQPEAFRRVLAAGTGPRVLRRAVYGGRPGHPVLIGRDHWDALRAELGGDRGAGPYLSVHGAVAVDCTGLGGDLDMDSGAPGGQ